MHAILVEADPAERALLQQALERRGWQVRTVRSAPGAASWAATGGFELAVVDCDPADEATVGVCRAIRSSAAGRAAFLLALTSDGGAEEARRAAAAGADAILVRPLTAGKVESAIAFAEGHLLPPLADATAAMRATSYPQRVADLEEALRLQQAVLEELFNSAPEGVVIVDEQDRIRRVNGEFSRMFGYSPAEALGHPVNELIAPDHLVEEAMRLTHGVSRGERIMVDTVRRRSDGSLVDVSVLATPIRVGGVPVGAFGIYRDITERQEHERALRASEARYRALFDQSPVGVFLLDERMRVTHCNERLPRIVHALPDAILGTDLSRLRDERLHPAIRRMAEGRVTAYEGPYRPVHGTEDLWISLRYAPLRDPDGRIIGGVGVVEDVTERERAEQRLRMQAAELERVNDALRERTLELEAALQTRSRLYTAINHELRTPISAIMLHQELLLAGTLGEITGDQREALEHANTAAAHLLELVVEVLDLSKLEAGRVSVSPVPTALGALLRDLHATALPLVRRYGSELHLDVGPGPDRIVTDPQRVRQVLLNLLSNAAKFGRGEPVTLRRNGTPDEIHLEVVDHGIGIGEEDVNYIFEDFVQVGTTQDGGTGLGLAISRRLAGLLGGRLEVDSRLGVGSTFRLVLPLAPPEGSD